MIRAVKRELFAMYEVGVRTHGGGDYYIYLTEQEYQENKETIETVMRCVEKIDLWKEKELEFNKLKDADYKIAKLFGCYPDSFDVLKEEPDSYCNSHTIDSYFISDIKYNIFENIVQIYIRKLSSETPIYEEYEYVDVLKDWYEE